MRPARGVSSYKCPGSYEKVISSGPNIKQLNPENAYPLLWCPSMMLICFQSKHLLNLTDKRLLSSRAPMMKTGQIRRCQVLDKLGDTQWVCTAPENIFSYQLRFKNNSFVLERGFAM